MKIIKKRLDEMERCYCTGHVTIDETLYALFASEQTDGPCYAYSGPEFSKKEIVWEKAGGTMSIIEIPGSNGQFLGVQNFFPGFNSENAKIVWGKRDPVKGWIIEDLLFLPYVHRFDILSSGGINYLVAATLCSSKQSREDWSDPGKIYVGVLPDNPKQPIQITPLLNGLVKNHGYWRGFLNGRQYGFFTCESGVYAVMPPETPNANWVTKPLLNIPVSDVAIFDLDGDGVDEIVTIEPFHGDKVKIYHQSDDGYRVVYTYPGEYQFAHALWAGRLRGKPAVILGIRRTNAELAIIKYSPENGAYLESVIEKGSGPSNVDVITQQDQDIILCANNSIHEAAVYFVTD
jgi:hypothetical protein